MQLDAEQSPRWWRFGLPALALHIALAFGMLSAPDSARRAQQRHEAARHDALYLQSYEVEVGTNLQVDEPSAAESTLDPKPAGTSQETRAVAKATPEKASRPTRSGKPSPRNTGAEEARMSRGTDSPDEPALPRKPLTLSQLGVGSGGADYRLVDPPTERADRKPPAGRGILSEREAQSALENSIHEFTLRSDQTHGLGPEGPVLSAVTTLARSEATLPNSTARIRFVTDSAGNLRSVDLVQSSSDPRPWHRVARRLLAQLRGQKLRLPNNGHGATFTVKVTVRAQLRSGADPGLGVNVLGIPLSKGQGPRSAQIDILNLNPQALKDPSLGTFGALLLARGDLADIGSPVQKIARAHVVSIHSNSERPSTPPASDREAR